MKEKIKRWYQCGLWTDEMVRNAIFKGVLSREAATEILDGGVNG